MLSKQLHPAFEHQRRRCTGAASDTGCFTSADVGNQALVPYTADYFLYKKDK
jgi:hypothetical protein